MLGAQNSESESAQLYNKNTTAPVMSLVEQTAKRKSMNNHVEVIMVIFQ